MSLQRSSARYVRHPRCHEAATVALIREYAHEQPVYGYRIIAAMLKHDGYRINRKRVYRIWRQEGLQLPRRRTMKRRYGDATGTLRRAGAPNEVWTYDFLEGRTERDGKLRMLTVLDEYTRECLTIHVARSISSRQVIQILEWLFLLRGAPGHLRSDKGPEFIAYALQAWLRDRCCTTLYIYTLHRAVPGKTALSRVSMVRFAVNVWTVGYLPAVRRHKSLSNNGVRSTITAGHIAAWAICRRLCLRIRQGAWQVKHHPELELILRYRDGE